MCRHGYVVLGAFEGRCQTQMTAGLSLNCIAINAQCFGKTDAAQVPRELHAGITSSLVQ